MSRATTLKNPYLGRPLGVKNLQPLQREQNAILSRRLDLMVNAVERAKEVERTLNPVTGRARHSTDGIINCVQMVAMLPWWRQLLTPFVGKYCQIKGVKYLKVGQTNIYYRAQEWIAGRAGKKVLQIVGSSKIPIVNELDLPKALSDGTACEVE